MDFLITRDEYGVPHVRAETATDVWAGMGYACAQDRLFQMDYDRRRACGRWAEVAGFPALGADVLARRLGLAAAAELDLAVMSAQVLAMFEAYASGVNQAIADGARPLPARYPVEAWQSWHSVAAFLVRHVQMGQWQHKLANAVLLARAGAGAFERLESRPPAGSPVAVPPDGRLTHPVAGLLDEALGDLEGHLGFLAEVEPGSNAWAVSGRRTAHGGAVLCNDSHRALDTPNVYWQCRVTCPDFDVTGATFPGLPGFPHFGSNGSVAWAITHGDADTQDLYLERFAGTRYLTPSGWAEAEVRHERIEVRGGSPVTVPVWATRHPGPSCTGTSGLGACPGAQVDGHGTGPTGGLSACCPCSPREPSRSWPTRRTAGSTRSTTGLVCADTRGDIACTSAAATLPRALVRTPPGGCRGPGLRTTPASGQELPCRSRQLPRSVDPEAGFRDDRQQRVMTDRGRPVHLLYVLRSRGGAEAWIQVAARFRQRARDRGPAVAGMQADTVSLQARGWVHACSPGSGRSRTRTPRRPRRRWLFPAGTGTLTAGSAKALLYACYLRGPCGGARYTVRCSGPRPGRGWRPARWRRRCPWCGAGSATTPGNCSAGPCPRARAR